MRNFILVHSLKGKRYNTPERYIIALDKERNYIISVAVVKRYACFDEDQDNFEFVYDTDNVEYVVKVLYKNSKGIYYKINGKRSYLTEDKVKELNVYIGKATIYLHNHNCCIPYSYDMITES